MADYCIPQIPEVTRWLKHLGNQPTEGRSEVSYYTSLRRTFLQFIAFTLASLDIEATTANEATVMSWKRSTKKRTGSPQDALRAALKDADGLAVRRYQIHLHRNNRPMLSTANSHLRHAFAFLSEQGLSELTADKILAVEDPPRIPPVTPVTDWLSELVTLTRTDETSEGEYSAATASIMHSQFLDYCGFAVGEAELELVLGDEGPELRWTDEAKRKDGGEPEALERVLIANGKATLTAHLRARANDVGKATLSTIAANLRRAYVYFQEAKLTDFDPKDVKTPDPEAENAITSLPVFEAMLNDRYPVRVVRNSRRHQLAKYLAYLVAALQSAKPKAKLKPETEETAYQALSDDDVKSPAVSVTKELLNRGAVHAPEYISGLPDDPNSKHYVSVVRQFYVWAVKQEYTKYDGSDLGLRRSSLPAPRVKRVSKQKALSLRKLKRKSSAKKRVRKAKAKRERTVVRTAGGRKSGSTKSAPPKKLVPWGAVLPDALVPRDRSVRFQGLERFLGTQYAAIQQLVCGPLQLDLTQVSLLPRKAFRAAARTLDVPTASGQTEAKELDEKTFAALEQHHACVSVGGVAHAWERGNSLFVARDGGKLFYDDSSEAYPAEIGVVIGRNKTATAVMRDTGLTLPEIASLRRAAYDSGKLRTPKGRVTLDGGTVSLFSSFFQVVRVSNSFSSIWTMMEEVHALFFACDFDNLTA